MFTWLNKQGVQSDQGFAVQFTGRFSAEYREAGKQITLRVEDGLTGGKPSIIIDPDAFEHWDGGGVDSQIPPEKQAEILQNFKAAIEFQGLVVAVEAAQPDPEPRSFRR